MERRSLVRAAVLGTMVYISVLGGILLSFGIFGNSTSSVPIINTTASPQPQSGPSSALTRLSTMSISKGHLVVIFAAHAALVVVVVTIMIIMTRRSRTLLPDKSLETMEKVGVMQAQPTMEEEPLAPTLLATQPSSKAIMVRVLLILLGGAALLYFVRKFWLPKHPNSQPIFSKQLSHFPDLPPNNKSAKTIENHFKRVQSATMVARSNILKQARELASQWGAIPKAVRVLRPNEEDSPLHTLHLLFPDPEKGYESEWDRKEAFRTIYLLNAAAQFQAGQDPLPFIFVVKEPTENNLRALRPDERVEVDKDESLRVVVPASLQPLYDQTNPLLHVSAMLSVTIALSCLLKELDHLK